MKNFLAIVLLASLVFTTSNVLAAKPAPSTGPKIVALDAGHGGTETGAVNQTYGVQEKDLNLAVVYKLRELLEASGYKVVLTREGDETLSSRKSRVDYAIEKCKQIYGRKCDILVSVHHNGSSNSGHDGTLVIYNEKQDKPLATALHNVLVPLTGNDEGYLNGGYGMTVYGHLVSALTEAYYITDDAEANLYLQGTPFATPSGYQVLIGDRVLQEAQAQLAGINNYFNK